MGGGGEQGMIDYEFGGIYEASLNILLKQELKEMARA